jgi:hypothetical protein
LKVYHWGTEIGACYHYGSYIDVTPTLINELGKYDCNLEAFLVENDINYNIIKPAEIIKSYNPTPGLHLNIKWDGWWRPNSGTINGNYFYYRCNQYRGNYIELIYNHRPYYSYWKNLPDYVKPYFDYIRQELEETNYIRHPQKLRIGNKVANLLPEGFKAYKTDDDDQCKVARSKEKYCYIKRFRDCEYYTSFSTNSGLHPSIKSSSLQEAVEKVEKILEMVDAMPAAKPEPEQLQKYRFCLSFLPSEDRRYWLNRKKELDFAFRDAQKYSSLGGAKAARYQLLRNNRMLKNGDLQLLEKRDGYWLHHQRVGEPSSVYGSGKWKIEKIDIAHY